MIATAINRCVENALGAPKPLFAINRERTLQEVTFSV
jgi:hypothetical protein